MGKYIVCLVFVLSLSSGCSQHLQGVVFDIGTEKKLNNETGLQYAKDILDTWAFRSGAIRAVLGGKVYLDDMVGFMRAMDSLDRLEAKKDSLTERELGEAVGTRLLIFNAERKELKKHLPSIFKLIARFL